MNVRPDGVKSVALYFWLVETDRGFSPHLHERGFKILHVYSTTFMTQ